MSSHLYTASADGDGTQAPPLGVQHWVDPTGAPMERFELEDMGDGYKLLFCFQHACPGCHTLGFPSLTRLIDALRGARVRFAAIQTVFEDFAHNSYDNMLQDQLRYALPIPFGHDAGPDQRGSVLMQRYGNGGTPWFILIDPQGKVLHSHFRIDVNKTMALLRRTSATMAAAAGVAPAGTPNWGDVVRWANAGNPPPPRRVEKTDAQWRAQLSPEQYRVMRDKGTEAAHSSELCTLFEPGRYHCAGCDTLLFDASAKYRSSSGWPSFTQPASQGVVAYLRDDSHGMRRIETICQVCDAHLGHVFPDGPAPSGLRYCINALALQKAD